MSIDNLCDNFGDERKAEVVGAKIGAESFLLSRGADRGRDLSVYDPNAETPYTKDTDRIEEKILKCSIRNNKDNKNKETNCNVTWCINEKHALFFLSFLQSSLDLHVRFELDLGFVVWTTILFFINNLTLLTPFILEEIGYVRCYTL